MPRLVFLTSRRSVNRYWDTLKVKVSNARKRKSHFKNEPAEKINWQAEESHWKVSNIKLLGA